MERIHSQIKDQNELAKQVLWWITYTKRPLTTSKLQHALAVEIGEPKLDKDNLPQIEDMVSVCAGLVTVDKESSIIRLVHYTTQEYFDRTQGRWFPDAQTNIATICATYLSFEEFEIGICQNEKELEQRLRLNQLYDYAAHNWGHHAREASDPCHSVMKFLEKETQLQASTQTLMLAEQYPCREGSVGKISKQMTGLHLAAYFGLYEIVRYLLSSNNPDPKDSYGRTPLSWAAEKGHKAVMRLLLDAGAELETKETLWGRTPLLWAAEKGHSAVIRLLLDQGAEIEARDERWGQTPLLWVAERRNEAVIRLLLDKGAKFEAKDCNNRTSLWWAARNGHEAIVQLLLNKGAKLEAKDRRWDRTALSWAAEKGHEALVKLLIDKGAELETRDTEWGQTPLLWAAEEGHEAVVRLLLDKGAKLEAKEKENHTPLLWAARREHEAVVKLLLNKGAELEAKDADWCQTPLLMAAEEGHEAVMKLLPDQGAELDVKYFSGQTLLLEATLNGHEVVVNPLFGCGRG